MRRPYASSPADAWPRRCGQNHCRFIEEVIQTLNRLRAAGARCWKLSA